MQTSPKHRASFDVRLLLIIILEEIHTSRHIFMVRSSMLTLRFFYKNKLKAGCSEASLFPCVNIDGMDFV